MKLWRNEVHLPWERKTSINNFFVHARHLLELEIDELSHANRVDKVLEKLDTLYLKDKIQLAYYAYDNFEKFRRPTDMTIAEFAVEFERLHNKAKAHEMVLPDGILAYKFSNNANISDSREKLIRATMTYDNSVIWSNERAVEKNLWRFEYICSIK